MGKERRTTSPIRTPIQPSGPIRRPGERFGPSTSDEVGHGGDHIPSIYNSDMMMVAKAETATRGGGIGDRSGGRSTNSGGTRGGGRDGFGPSTSDEVGHGGDHIPSFLDGIGTMLA